MKHPAPVDERDRVQPAAVQRMRNSHHTNRARQHRAEMLQSVAYLVGAGKTVALRAALASLAPSRHTLIYLGNPSVGVRGINHAIVSALGGGPKPHHATLTPQAMDLLAREHAERGRVPVLAIDEAQMLEPGQLEAVRMLTNHDYPGSTVIPGARWRTGWGHWSCRIIRHNRQRESQAFQEREE